ncbi:hypothetical protein [Desulfobacter curvatus]|uniref:hypothetical protein n=1 Tax=Desulfobacter curvatus TaxID=2290 RepID=UPI0003766D19|nr:hypothetical protein [Desulfobacter curvatus]
MKFFILDIILAILVSLIIICSSSYISYNVDIHINFPDRFEGIILILIFLIIIFIMSCICLKIIRILVPLKSGKYSLQHGIDGISWKLQGFLYIFNLGPLLNTYLVPINLRSLFYTMLGAKISFSSMIGGKILEPPMVTIGANSILGEDTLIIGHSVEGGYVVLGEVIIGNNVTIGVKSVIMPDVAIGDGSIIAANSVVIKGTKIGENELWAGSPAKKLKEL